ncbi:type VI secretion system baseplate subunit TssG [Marinibactrum halimedae]|uniref:Type VI secretion system protein n=1 Tax=Marinibactrum halimedae TaxID=1444977 RepID=A0AA37WND4_9GAMM|nr:type VI secretion system baseplate subunit TssG [Marinibactrum halimedae]MCD9458364.1 type VI secretion system baseplate subunit TssG [Marinibactrum halimedae]GLS26061.1 type VI secretion system protein [Marinibactrum halimedae]
MATQSRRKSAALIDQLVDTPYQFEFFQAVRLLERAAALAPDYDGFASAPPGGRARAGDEAIRFRNVNRLAFNNSDISDIKAVSTVDFGDQEGPEQRWQVDSSILGLTGSHGVMPYYLSEQVIRELKQKNPSLKEFLDIFEHRTLSLFYEAWHKYQLPVNYERNKQLSKRRPDSFTHLFLSLIGLGFDELSSRMRVRDEALIGTAAIFARGAVTEEGIRQLMKHHFDLDVTVKQFVGSWQELPPDILTRLPGEDVPAGQNNCLGLNAIIGSHSFQAQGKFAVIVEPLPIERYMELSPGSRKLESIKSLLDFATGNEFEFEIEVSLSSASVPPVQLEDEAEPMLGWNTHLDYKTDSTAVTIVKLPQDICAPDEGLPVITEPSLSPQLG